MLSSNFHCKELDGSYPYTQDSQDMLDSTNSDLPKRYLSQMLLAIN
jgi:hypothetical protein